MKADLYRIDVRIWRRKVLCLGDRLKLRVVKWLVKPWIDIRFTVEEDESYIPERPVAPSKGGRVVKATGKKSYDPLDKKVGGRVVKIMPKHVKKLKEGQDDVPEMQIPE